MFEVDLLGGERSELATGSQEGCAGRFVQSLLCSASGSRVEAYIQVTMPQLPPPASLFPIATLSSLPRMPFSFCMWLSPALSLYPSSGPKIFNLSLVSLLAGAKSSTCMLLKP